MDFIEQLQSLATKTNKLCSVLQTEEATKNALIMPFINILGYDIFDPTEVIPEFIADIGIKKGEKVDYAIVKDGKISCSLNVSIAEVISTSITLPSFSGISLLPMRGLPCLRMVLFIGSSLTLKHPIKWMKSRSLKST